MIIESWYDDWWTYDCYNMFCYVNSKTYVLCMIFTYYVIYVMIMDHALIVKFYIILVCLFLESLPLCCCMCVSCPVMIPYLMYVGNNWLWDDPMSLGTSWMGVFEREDACSIFVSFFKAMFSVVQIKVYVVYLILHVFSFCLSGCLLVIDHRGG